MGPLGFLSMGDEVLPGNLGLWDQIKALQWVQENVASFGGDPKRVTIFGNSAGSSSVMFHVLSPQSRGLFQQAIAQSGVPNSLFVHSDKHPAYYARTYAMSLGCDPEGTSKEILSCLQNIKDPLTMVDSLSTNGRFWNNIMPMHPFKPVIDGTFYSDRKDAFLPDEPMKLFESGKYNDVPLVIGATRDEGLLFLHPFVKEATGFQELQEEWNPIMATVLFGREPDEIDTNELDWITKVSARFLGETVPTELDENLKRLLAISGDTYFNHPISKTAKIMAEKGSQPIYEYLYTHEGSVSLADFFRLTIPQILIKVCIKLKLIKLLVISYINDIDFWKIDILGLVS